MRSLLIILLFLVGFASSGQQSVDIRLRKNLRDKLDEIVFQYEQYSRFSSVDEINSFRRLFAEDALIFDYLTPNYVTRNTGTELIKQFDDFVGDVRRDFPEGLLQSRIVDTNLGEAINYNRIDWSSPSLNVLIRLKTVAPYYEGGQFSNDAVLSLTVEFDTLSRNVTNFKIRNVAKVSSNLRYQQEERRPVFEKMLVAKGFQSWNDVLVEESDGNFFASNPTTAPLLSQSYGMQFIKIISAPEPEEFAYSIGINYTMSDYRITSDLFNYTVFGQDINGNGVWKSAIGNQMTEVIRSELIEFPFQFRYERKFNRYLSVFGNIGLSLTYQFRATHRGQGIFTYLENDERLFQPVDNAPELGYARDTLQEGSFVRTSGQLSRDNFGINGTADLGFNIENKSGWVYYLGITGFKGVVNNNRLVDFNYVSSRLGDYNGMFPMLNSINFGGYGVFFGVRKRFRSRNGLVKMVSQ